MTFEENIYEESITLLSLTQDLLELANGTMLSTITYDMEWCKAGLCGLSAPGVMGSIIIQH
jgi:hypothetical protein